MGLVFGAFWGVLQFWDEFSLSRLCAAGASGAVFVLLLGVGASWIERHTVRACCLAAASGAAAGAVWWVIARPQFSIPWSIAAGAGAGSLLWLWEGRQAGKVAP
jgi:hypothetical protein